MKKKIIKWRLESTERCNTLYTYLENRQHSLQEVVEVGSWSIMTFTKPVEQNIPSFPVTLNVLPQIVECIQHISKALARENKQAVRRNKAKPEDWVTQHDLHMTWRGKYRLGFRVRIRLGFEVCSLESWSKFMCAKFSCMLTMDDQWFWSAGMFHMHTACSAFELAGTLAYHYTVSLLTWSLSSLLSPSQ